MARFCTVARTRRPQRVRYSASNDAAVTQQRERHHEQAVDRDVDAPRSAASEPISQSGSVGAHFLGAEDGAEGLLHDQAQAPGREQRVERPLVEVPDQHPFDQPARAPNAITKATHDREQEVVRPISAGRIAARSAARRR